MVEYTRENVKGIIFKCGQTNYKIIRSLPKMHLKDVTYSHSKWEDLDYCDANNVANLLNDGIYKVIEQPIKIYELW